MFKNDGPDVALLFSYSAPEVNAEHYSQQAYFWVFKITCKVFVMQIWFFERNFLSRLKEGWCDVACTEFLLLSFQLLPKGMNGVIMAEATSQDTEG